MQGLSHTPGCLEGIRAPAPCLPIKVNLDCNLLFFKSFSGRLAVPHPGGVSPRASGAAGERERRGDADSEGQ